MTIKKQVNLSQLALFRRRPVDPELRKNYPDEYLAEIRLSGWKEIHWTRFREDAELFDKSRLKRDIFERIPTLQVEYRDFDIQINGKKIETEFEVVELIEKKSFGFIIKQIISGSSEHYLSGIYPGVSEQEKYTFLNSVFNATLLDKEMMNVILEDLRRIWPGSTFDYKELFCE